MGVTEHGGWGTAGVKGIGWAMGGRTRLKGVYPFFIPH